MRYLLMICANEVSEAAASHEDTTAMMAGYATVAEEMNARNVLRDGNRLRPISDATTVRVRNSEILSTDGPFAETKEQMGGYYIVDVADLDEAIAVAAKIPSAQFGSIEIRPIWEE